MNKAQSEVIGVVILLGISMTAIGIMFVFAQPTYSQSTQEINFDRVANEFALLDSKTATSALGASETQSVELNIEGGELRSEPDAGWMNISHEYINGAGNTVTEELANVSMGRLEYTDGEENVAYEGGGVWRKETGNENSYMMSPPEFHYEGNTLTLPLFNVTSRLDTSQTGGGQSSIAVDSDEIPNKVFEDNPLESGKIIIKVGSEYYEAWANYFDTRTVGNSVVNTYDGNRTARIELIVPDDQELEGSIMYNPDGDLDEPSNPNVEVEQDTTHSGNLPDGEDIVQNRIGQMGCEPGVDCPSLPNPNTVTSISAGEYAEGNLLMNDQYVFDLSGGDIEIAVEGDLNIEDEVKITPNGTGNSVEFFVEGDVDFQSPGEVNKDGTSNPRSMVIFVGGEAFPGGAGLGNSEMYGIIYAPETNDGLSSCTGGSPSVSGSGSIHQPTWTGAIIVHTICLQGNPYFAWDSSLNGYSLDLTTDQNTIQYLHITDNEIQAER